MGSTGRFVSAALWIAAVSLGSFPRISSATGLVANPDPFLWLEEMQSPQSTSWVTSHNAPTAALIEGDARFAPLKQSLKEIYVAQDKLDEVTLTSRYAYRVATPADHEIGLWQRQELESFLGGKKSWSTLIDLDALWKAEGIKWYLTGFDESPQDPDLLLVSLSHEGRDAEVAREFRADLSSFPADGFAVPEGKGRSIWIDRDHLLVASTAIGPATSAGYPAQARLWTRGTPLAQSRVLHEIDPSWMSLRPGRFVLDGVRVPALMSNASFWETRYSILKPDFSLDPVASASLKSDFLGRFQGWNVFRANEALTEDGTAIPAGVLFGLKGGVVRQLFAPASSQSIEQVSVGAREILVLGLEHVNSKVWRILAPDQPATEVLLPRENLTLSLDSESEAGVLFSMEGFLTPPSLAFYRFGVEGTTGAFIQVQETPEMFPADSLMVEQRFVPSIDGTLIPYFLVRDKNTKMDGTTPTILWGYGGFDISLKPFYASTYGRAWLTRGGAFAVANIRGGGEYGPSWHFAATGKNKQRSFDDFIAVASDLIRIGLTSPRRLGIAGGSNGGLLVGAVALQRPDLFNAALSMNPLLDMVRYTKLFAGASWVGEYGDPEDADPEVLAAILRYSPYQNIKAGMSYPRMMITTASSDDRVHPGHARKFAAQMEAMGHSVLFFEDTEGGHNLGTPDSDAAERARRFVYFYQQLMD